jgi:hypothetical protein
MSVSATPNLPISQSARQSSSVKSATPDLILEDTSSLPESAIEKLIFENIGGQELLLLARHDTISGQRVAYQKIQNAREIDFRYGSDTVLSTTESFKDYFRNFPILIETNVPEIEGNEFAPNAYVDPTTGNLVLEFVELRRGQEVQVQTISSADVFDDIIY